MHDESEKLKESYGSLLLCRTLGRGGSANHRLKVWFYLNKYLIIKVPEKDGGNGALMNSWIYSNRTPKGHAPQCYHMSCKGLKVSVIQTFCSV